MFREMRRFKQQVSREDCERVLREAPRGVLSLIGDDGYPYGIPMDFFYVPEENIIYFHCAKVGHKIDAIKACTKGCFTVWDEGFKKAGDWAWNITSVIAFGQLELIGDPQRTREKVFQLALKYYPTQEEAQAELDSAASRVQLIALHIEHLTGKLVNEK